MSFKMYNALMLYNLWITKKRDEYLTELQL